MISVIGCGYWGKNLVRVFSKMGVLSSVCDSSEHIALAMSESFNAPSQSWRAILADSAIQAVAIATPASTHATFIEQALNANKHVFVEKPFATDLNDAKQLATLAREKKRTLMIGHLLQYHAGFIKLVELVKQGKLGKVHYIHTTRLSTMPLVRDEDVIWDLGPHDVSMVLELMGQMPECVQATGECYQHKTLNDAGSIQMSFVGGVKAHCFMSWVHPLKEQKFVVVGQKGMLIFDDIQSWETKLRMIASNGVVKAIPVDTIFPLDAECEHFVDCFTQGKIPKTGPEEGLRVLKVIEQAKASLHAEEGVLV